MSFCLGAVLLFAALLKGHQLLTDFRAGTTILTSRAFQTLTVEVELALSLWLLAGLYRRWTVRVALAWFFLLACVSGYLVTMGYECCGCLGRLAVSPWFTFGFNLAAICSLVLCPLPENIADSFQMHPYRAVGALAAYSFMGLYLLVALPTSRVASTSYENLGSDDEVVILDVENWQGKLLPILEHIDIRDRLRAGKWLLVLYHSDCFRCEEVLAKLVRTEQERTALVAIEVPHLSRLPATQLWKLPERFESGQLAWDKRWSVATPVIIYLDNGTVTLVVNGA